MPANLIVRAIVGALVASAMACSSPKHDAYERVAREANLTLLMLKPAIARMDASSGSDRELIDACTSVDDQLELLRQVKFDDEAIDPDPQPHRAYTRVSDFAEHLLGRSLICNDEDLEIDTGCRRWCLEAWSSLIVAVDLLRQNAKEEGVHIISLMKHPFH